MGRWGVGSLCGNYHKTIIQIQIQDQVHIRVTIKPETEKNREKTAKKTPPIRAGLKLTLLGYYLPKSITLPPNASNISINGRL